MSLQTPANLLTLPDNLLIPQDDGAAAHLLGLPLPAVDLQSTASALVSLATLKNWAVIYVYPLTGEPGKPLPTDWDLIPGARGCTPQACDFSNHYQQLKALNAAVYGLSSQATDYQLALQKRLHLPFELLSDSNFQLKKMLNLPTFEVGNLVLYKRLTLITFQGEIKKVFYPVFPPNQHASAVVSWLQQQQKN